MDMKLECIPLSFSNLINKKWINNEEDHLAKPCTYLNRKGEYQLLQIAYKQVYPDCYKLCTTMNYESTLELTQEDGLLENEIGIP